MDFDSSSKFISSLAKFLQSLCNGYVEFNNGVEVIGHIYINVDTGKKIDYVLNEKVCKTDENSVTFISNSFHAQPAEKPKQPDKLPKAVDNENTAASQQDEIIIMDEPESENIGTVPPHQQRQKSHPSKRSHPQSFSSGHRQQSKFSRTEQSLDHNGSQLNTDPLHSENTSSRLHSVQYSGNVASDADTSHLSNHPSNHPNVFSHTYSDPSSSQLSAEERDIKPQIGTDVEEVSVKQEYDPNQQTGEEQEGYDDSQGAGGVFPGMQYDQYYGDGSQRGSMYGQMGGTSQDDYYHGGTGVAGDGSAGDPKGVDLMNPVPETGCRWTMGLGCPVRGCGAKTISNVGCLKEHWAARHEELVVRYKCPACSFASKRKRNVFQHYRQRHGGGTDAGKTEFVVNMEYQHNSGFIPPGSFTLNMLLGKCD